MAIFDKNGDGVLDTEEIKAFKDYWTKATSKPGTAADAAAADQAAFSLAPVQVGCGCPGGFCCCRCGHSKGGRCLPSRPYCSPAVRCFSLSTLANTVLWASGGRWSG
jgi:hypothetical protein